MRWKMAAKDSVIMKYEEELAYKKWDNNVKIKQEMYVFIGFKSQQSQFLK